MLTELFPDKKPMIIAGPCSAESEGQVMDTAVALRQLGISVFRAGIWKPRTHPGCFEGIGERALTWLGRVRKELGMAVCTEVASKSHVEACLNAAVDMVWLGARTTANPFLVQEIAEALKGSGVPVLVKNPINPDIELWVGAVERLRRQGIGDIGVIHRGFSTFEPTKFRNAPYWRNTVEMRGRFPELPFFCDPSHLAGFREFVGEISQRALDLGFDGLMIESHCRPESALSDSAQQLTPEELGRLLRSLSVRHHGVPAGSDGAGHELEELRGQIGVIDTELVRLLGERMCISRGIGRLKRANNMSILQMAQWDKVMSNVLKQAELNAVDARFAVKLFNIIHTASVAEQDRIMENKED